jgi:hypothetical protein
LESTPRGETHWNTRHGPSHRAQPHDHQPHLAGVRLATAS